MWLGSVFRVMLLLPCAVATLSHQTAVGNRTADRSGPDNPLAPSNPNDITGQINRGKDGALGHNQEDEKNAPRLLSHSPDQSPKTTDQDNTSHLDPKHPAWKAQCLGLVDYHGGVLGDLLNALTEGWGKESEVEKEDLTRFALCSNTEEKSSNLLSTLSVLAESAGQDRNRLFVLHPAKVLWELDTEDQSSGLRLHFLLPSLLHSQLSTLMSALIFFLGDSIQTDGLGVSFRSNSLQPHKQTVCISTGTQFIVLTGIQMDSRAHGHVALRITVETNQAENGSKLDLSELQAYLVREGEANNGTAGPVLLFRMDQAPNSPDSRVTPERNLSTAILAPSRTFLFLCDLQKFLSEVLPEEKLESLPAQTAPVSLDTLQSLPPLTLGASSSEPLLLGLLNSSVPTLFSFPRQVSELQEHRVELTLQPPLLAMLRLRLEEAVTQMIRESVGGRGIRDRLRQLQELCALPMEGEDPPAGDTREAQYRALLLLKALQTVLGAWEEERGQRAARGGQQGSGRCQLHSLTVSLKKYLLNPSTTNINNCQGSCTFPLTNANNHVILLNSHKESDLPLERPPCCVPVEYDDLQVAELDGVGTKISIKPNMIAKACGCR